jgi:hypothetical protein
MRILCLSMLALIGCKTTDSLPGATTLDLAMPTDLMPPADLMPLPGVTMGSFGGIAFQPASAIAATGMLGAGGTLGFVYMTNKALFCQQLSMSPPIQPKNITGLLMFLGVSDGAGNETAPAATGAYPIVTGGSGTAGNTAQVKFVQTDATCMTNAATGEDAVSGTVNLTSVANTNYAGTFDLMMQHGGAGAMDHVTGEFHATNCPGFAAIFNTNPACEM